MTNQSDQLKDLIVALSKVQSELKTAKKKSTNPFFRSTYADLTEVWDSCRDALTKNGFAITQTTEFQEGHWCLKTTLLHSSGQWICGYYPIVTVKQDPQSYGSATTYSRRYSLAAIVGVCTEDDDGESAMVRDVETALPSSPILKPTESLSERT